MTILDRAARLPAGRRSRFAVLAAWVVLAVLAAPLALRLTEVQNNETLGALPATAESSAALDRARQAFPGSDAPVAVAVYARDSGITTADRATVDSDRAWFARYAQHGAVPEVVPSPDGQALLVSFPLAGDQDARGSAVDAVKDRLAGEATGGLRTALTGSAAEMNDVFDAFAGMDSALLLATVAAVVLLLLLTYRSPVLWLVPLAAVAVASQIAAAVVYLLARHAGLAVDFQSQSILTVLVFGVGVDYALLLIARYREELRGHPDRSAAMAAALRRTLPAVCASAGTVAVGLLCLLAARLPATHGLGPVCAVGVLAALLVMTTLLPALLVVCGRWVFWPFVPRYSPGVGDRGADRGGWRRLAGLVGRRPKAVWIGTVGALALLCLGIGRLSIGMPDDETFSTPVGSVTGQHLVAAHYPGGTAAPADLLAAAGAAGPVAAAAGGVPGVATVEPPRTSADGRWVRIPVVLAAPPGSAAATDTVARLRAAVHRVPDADALVGGDTAVALDTDRAVSRDNRVVMPLILVTVGLVLAGLLRALVAPLLLLGAVVLCYLAALGGAGLVLAAMGHPRLWNALPLQAFLFLVALGVDYTIFLMTRAREEVARSGHRAGVLRALTRTGGVITSAGVVLAATFGALGVLPLVPSVQMGVVVAVGVLLDTVLVRSLLIPALVLHVGPRTWWPGRLARTTTVDGAPVRDGTVPVS